MTPPVQPENPEEDVEPLEDDETVEDEDGGGGAGTVESRWRERPNG